MPKEDYLRYWDVVQHVYPEQYFCSFGVTPHCFNFLPPVATEIKSEVDVSLRPLFEVIAFSPRVGANEFFFRCLNNFNAQTQEAFIGCDLGYNREVLKEEQVLGVLEKIIEEVSSAFGS